MKNARIVFLLISFCFSAYSAHAKSHKLINQNLAGVGNKWQYQMHITQFPGEGTVDWWGSATEQVVGNEVVAGYDTAVFHKTFTITSPFSLTKTESANRYLSSDCLKGVHHETEEWVNTVRNNNPWELMPVWVDESDSNLHFGYGEYDGEHIPPDYTWYGERNAYITFLRIEQIAVPAGTFDCVVVLCRDEWSEPYDWHGYDETTYWMNPGIGIIRSDQYEWNWNPETQQASVSEFSTKLTSFCLSTDPLGTWNGTIDSDNYGAGSGTISDWILRCDGTTDGYWDIDIGGGSVVSFNPSGNYTYSDCQLQFSCSGTARESGYGTTSPYTLDVTGTIDGDTATGSYYIDFTNIYWSDYDTGTWQVGRELGTDWYDVEMLGENWLEVTCECSNDWCDGVDFDYSSTIDFVDFCMLAQHWLQDQ
ncbi:MAG: hypothetical protein KAS96_11590 [Planctomycetes bacterium]|nr:hypothetical protein [Planctomycetota bacterium]